MKSVLSILHTESHRSWGGQELRVFNECMWMRQKGHRVLLAAPKASLIYSRARSANLPVIPFAFINPTVVADYFRLRALLKRLAPDVLNTHGNLDAKVGLMAARGLGIPCVIRSRHHSHPVSPSWYNKWMYRKLSHYVFTTAQCVSDQIVADLAVRPDKVVTLGSGIVLPQAMPDKIDAIRGLQQEFDLAGDSRFVGSVAMLRDWKGHRFLMEAFRQISGRFPAHHLVIVGDGDEMAALQRLREALGLADKVHFTGFKDDPWPFFRAFELNVLASTCNEGIPQVLLQAMAAGCPVIGTRVGGIPDIVEEGRTGLLVEPQNAAMLADAMAFVLDNPEKTAERVHAAQQGVLKNHTLDAMGKRTLDLYAKVLPDMDCYDLDLSIASD